MKPRVIMSAVGFLAVSLLVFTLHLWSTPRDVNWAIHGLNQAETRFSTLTDINKNNIHELSLHSFYTTDLFYGMQATPLSIDGYLYFSGKGGIVYKVSVETGALMWKWDPKIKDAHMWNTRGVAYRDGAVFVATVDGQLASLDSNNGKVNWKTQFCPEDTGMICGTTGAPRIVKDKIIVGNAHSEWGARGFVAAFFADSGQLAWRFYTVPGNPAKGFENEHMKKAAKTWTGEWWKFGGGGTVWDSMAYDSSADILYVGTGNGAPWNRRIRSPQGGDNLFVSSILALDPDTGDLLWYFQESPQDTWDHTANQHMILTDLSIENRSHRVLMQAPKNGFFYVLDRLTGRFISGTQYVKEMNWASGLDKKGRPIETAGADYTEPRFIKPGTIGGHNWQPMSYSPRTGLVYFPAMETQKWLKSPKTKFNPKPGTFRPGVDSEFSVPEEKMDPSRGDGADEGYLLAWDPVKKKAVWRYRHRHFWNGGVLSTAADLVFQGTADGYLMAFDAVSGKKLWDSYVDMGILAPPITYRYKGEQYVSVLTGWGGCHVRFTGGPARILTFKRGGKANLPITPRRTAKDLEPISHTYDEGKVERGKRLFDFSCLGCHDGITFIPDLRYSSEAVFNAFEAMVNRGMSEVGMPAFRQDLNAEQIDSIKHYLIKERTKLVTADN